MKKPVLVVSISVATLLSPSAPCRACIAYFGYDAVTADNADDIAAAVSVSTGLFNVTNENDDIVNDIYTIVGQSGPVVLGLTDIIFNPTQFTDVDCTRFERGGLHETKTYSYLRGDYQQRLDRFFQVNGDLFRPPFSVIGIAVHLEANNACATNWRITQAANYVKQKLDALGPNHFVPRILAGYGLRNVPGTPAISEGFPISPSTGNPSFPPALNSVAYWAYDILNPNNPSDPDNVNQDSWTLINQKLNQALKPGQTTFGVLKAYCQPGGPEETPWGVTCPSGVAKLEELANNWRTYWLSDPRNEVVIGFLWPDARDPQGNLIFYGAENLPLIQNEHSAINNSRNCQMNFLWVK